MKNKEIALNKIEQIEGALNNLKSSALRSDLNALPLKFERMNTLIEDLRSLINTEEETLLTRTYTGL